MNKKIPKILLLWLLILSLAVPAGILSGCGEKKNNAEAFPEVMVPLDEDELRELERSSTGTALTEEPESQTVTSPKDTQEKRKKNKKPKTRTETKTETSDLKVEEDGTYTSKEEVAFYIYSYGHLPDNYITKEEAKDLGWISREGNLDEVAPGMSIGGDYFGNYEKLLPTKKGRDYYECDIDYHGGYRNEKRIIFSDDGLIYYTEDHYETFEQLY